MNEVIRFRQPLGETVRSDINGKDLSEHPKSSSIHMCHVMVMP